MFPKFRSKHLGVCLNSVFHLTWGFADLTVFLNPLKVQLLQLSWWRKSSNPFRVSRCKNLGLWESGYVHLLWPSAAADCRYKRAKFWVLRDSLEVGSCVTLCKVGLVHHQSGRRKPWEAFNTNYVVFSISQFWLICVVVSHRFYWHLN